MPSNDKSLRLQALRDHLHLIVGEYAGTCVLNVPDFNKAVALNAEIISTVRSLRNLALVARDIRKLRDKTVNPTAEQLEKLALLDEKLQRKREMARNRLKAREAKRNPKRGRKSKAQPVLAAPTSPASLADLWATPEAPEATEAAKEGDDHGTA